MCLCKLGASNAQKRDESGACTHLRVLERSFSGRRDLVWWCYHHGWVMDVSLPPHDQTVHKSIIHYLLYGGRCNMCSLTCYYSNTNQRMNAKLCMLVQNTLLHILMPQIFHCSVTTWHNVTCLSLYWGTLVLLTTLHGKKVTRLKNGLLREIGKESSRMNISGMVWNFLESSRATCRVKSGLLFPTTQRKSKIL